MKRVPFRSIEYDYNAILKMNRAICKQAGLEVKYFPDGDNSSVPCTDGKTIFIPKPLPTFTPEEWNRWLNVNFHEVGHNLPECCDSFDEMRKRKLGSDGFYGSMTNLIDDYRVDRTRCEQYRGMSQSNDTAMRYWATKNATLLEDNDHKSKELDVVHTLMAFDIYNRQGWSPSLRGVDAMFTKDFSEQQKEWFKTLTNKYSDKYHDTVKASDIYDLLDDMLKNVFDIDPEKEKEKNREQNKKQGKGTGKGNPNKDEKESKGKGERNADSSEGSGERNTREQECSVDYQKLLESMHDEDFRANASKLAPMHISYDSYSENNPYDPHRDDTIKVIDLHLGKTYPQGTFNTHHRSTNVFDIRNRIGQLHVPAMAQEARRLLQVLTRKRNFYNQKKGRLDINKIYRVCQPHSSVSERIFKTKTENNALDTAVSVLVDYSGSMGGSKIQTAISAGYALEILCSMLKINCEVAGFTECGRHVNYHYVFKNFGHSVQEAKFLESMSIASSRMSSNADGDSILVAWHRLLQQKQKRKVLIVLSDGSPASGRGDCYTYTKEIVRGIESRGDTDIIGIGIQDDNVTRIYKHHHVIDDIKQLPGALIKTLEHAILPDNF